MFLTNWAIRKYMTIFVFVVFITIIGSVSYLGLPRESTPDIKIPYVIVSTMYLGVAPPDIENLITNKIEAKLKNLQNVEKITSLSGDSISMIVVQYKPDVDIDTALQKVKEKVDLAKPDLPDDAKTPVVSEVNISEFPIMYINVSGPFNQKQLTDIGKDLKEKLENVKGILSVDVGGALDREIQVLVDTKKMIEKQLSLGEIGSMIQRENLTIPGGYLSLGNLRYGLRIPGEYTSMNDINNIIIKERGGQSIFLRDIAKVKDTYKERNSYSRLNEKPTITLIIKKRSGENILAIAEKVRSTLTSEIKQYPLGTEFNITSDRSKDIRDMVKDLENSVATGFILVVLVVLISMGFVNSLFVSIAIPLSMLITFAIFSAMNVSLNMIVLFSLILVLGMLVDDAIVIVENIFRHLQMGKKREDAARDGTKEVVWPVVASTATNIAVFLPLLFWPGIMGKFMYFLPVTVVVSLTASLFVGFLINPVVCAKFMRYKGVQVARESHDKLPQKLGFIKQKYQKLLMFSLKHRALVMIFTIVLLFVSFFAYGIFGTGVEFMPDITPTRAFISIKAPEGSNLDYTDSIVRQVEKLMVGKIDIHRYISTTGGQSQSTGMISGGSNTNEGQVVLVFYDRFNDQDKVPKGYVINPNRAIDAIVPQLKHIPGATIEYSKESMGPPSGAAIGILITGDDFRVMGRISQEIQDKIKHVAGIANLKDDYVKGTPELLISIDRAKASKLGLSNFGTAAIIRNIVYGTKYSVYRQGQDEYDIVVKIPEGDRMSIDQLQNIPISNRDNQPILLSTIATIKRVSGTGAVRHYNHERSLQISADAHKRSSTEIRKDVKKILKAYTLPDGYKAQFVGENEEQDKAASFLGKAFMIGIFLIALILIAQFNSLFVPFIILFVVILSLIGVMWGLIVTHTRFGIIMSGVGVITLAGVVVKNAIVLLDFAIHLRNSGLSKHEALIQAGIIRFRPVMLTAITAVLGLVPMSTGFYFDFFEMAFKFGSSSSEWWRSMANAIIFGLILATLLTLVVTPVMYSLFDGLSERLKHRVKNLIK